MEYVTSQVNDNKIWKYAEDFMRMDKNNNGTIEYREKQGLILDFIQKYQLITHTITKINC